MVDYIRPKDLPPSTEIPTSTAIPIDTGSEVQRATPQQLVDIGRPISTQAEAIAGVDNTTAMTPLTVAQAMDNRLPGIIGPIFQPYVDLARAWAESPTPPNPADPDSKSAKTWAEQAREDAETLDQAVGFEQKTFVSVAGQLRYTVDVNGDPLDAMEGFSRLSGSAPFGNLVYGDDYTISDLGYNLTADPGNDRLFFSESFPRTSNTEAMTILQQVGEYTDVNAARAEMAADEASRLFMGARAVAPTEGPDGAPLLDGAIYYNTGDREPYVWDGFVWTALYDLYGGQVIQGSIVVDGGAKEFPVGNYQAVQVSLNGVTLTPGADFEMLPPNIYIPGVNDGDTLTYFAVMKGVGGDALAVAEEALGLATSVEEQLNAEVSAPYAIKPVGWQWPVQAFVGGRAEASKPEAAQNWIEILDEALHSGERVQFSNGAYPLRDAMGEAHGVLVNDRIPVDVELSSGAVIYLGAEYPVYSGAVLRFTQPDFPVIGESAPFRWSGGVFDASRLVTYLSSGLHLIDIQYKAGYSIRDAKFNAGVGFGGSAWGACDTAIITRACAGGVVENCDFIGFYDAGIYASGDVNDDWAWYGDFESAVNCRFYRVASAVNIKRQAQGYIADGIRTLECGYGVVAWQADEVPTRSGLNVQVKGGHFIRTQRRPIMLERGSGTLVSGVYIEDWGRNILTGDLMPNDGYGRFGGIHLLGSNGARVQGNHLRMVNWGGGTVEDGNERVGIFARDAATGELFQRSIVSENIIDGAPRPLLEGSSGQGNMWRDNAEYSPSAGTAFNSSIQAASMYLKPIRQFSLLYDVPSIPAGGQHQFSIPAAGIKVGDYIDSWTLNNRDAGGGFGNCSFELFCSTDSVQVVATNLTDISVDLGNGQWRVRVRPV